jgi:predicted amino acid-binding ACT domain protein
VPRTKRSTHIFYLLKPFSFPCERSQTVASGLYSTVLSRSYTGTSSVSSRITGGAGTAQTSHLIINAAGLDRLGIVSDVTGLVIAHGGNVGESVAGRLGASYFSLMMLVSVPEASRDALQHAVLSVPDLSSAVFTVDNVTTGSVADKPKPVIGCKCICP